MQRITNEQMQEAVERGLQDLDLQGAIESANKAADFDEKTVKGYVRDYGLLILWTGATCALDLSMMAFFVAMEQLVGLYSMSRVENFRSAVAWYQNLDPSLSHEQRWTQQEYFRTRFKGLLTRTEEPTQTKRGRIKEEKLSQSIDH